MRMLLKACLLPLAVLLAVTIGLVMAAIGASVATRCGAGWGLAAMTAMVAALSSLKTNEGDED